jgi:hypothetical protein
MSSTSLACNRLGRGHAQGHEAEFRRGEEHVGLCEMFRVCFDGIFFQARRLSHLASLSPRYPAIQGDQGGKPWSAMHPRGWRQQIPAERESRDDTPAMTVAG